MPATKARRNSLSAIKIREVFNDYLRGFNFAGIKFRGFRRFRKNREIMSRRKICNWPIREIKSFFFKQTYTVFIRYKTLASANLSNKKIIVVSYFSYFNLLFQVQPYRSAKFAKKFGQVPYAKFAKYFEMVRPRN